MTAIPLEMTRHPVARGFADKNGRMQVAVRMDETLFEAVHTLAASKNISFASQVRVLLRDGLDRIDAARETA